MNNDELLAILYIITIVVFVRLSVRPDVDLGFRISTNGQDLDGRTGPGPEIEVRRSAQG